MSQSRSKSASLREELEDASLQVIKDRIHKELVSMNNEDLHTFIRLQRESDRSQDPRTFNLNMLVLIDQVKEIKRQNAETNTKPTAEKVSIKIFSAHLKNYRKNHQNLRITRRSLPRKRPRMEMASAQSPQDEESATTK